MIDDSQNAFLLGRLITDNVLVEFETLHYLKRKTQGKLGFKVWKLDMSKAYDQVEWVFLVKVMEHLGFPNKLVSLMSSCMSTSPILSSLMANLWVTLNLQEDLDRVTLIYSQSMKKAPGRK